MGKKLFLNKFIFYFINEYNKIYIYSYSLHQDLYQKLFKYFSIYIPIHIIPNFFNEEGFHTVIDELVNNKDFEKSDCEIGTYESI